MQFDIDPRFIDKPDYKAHLFNSIMRRYADLIYERAVE
jgi:hypothetical protein